MRHPMTLLAFLLTLALASCHRDHLYYEDDAMAAVRLMVDWEPSGMTPNGMTVLAYRQDGTLYKHFGPIATPDGCMLYLPQGRYDLVILSDTPEEYEGNLSFENMTFFEGLRAVGSRDGEHTEKLQEYLASQSSQDYCMMNPEDLGVDVVRNVEITSDEIAYYYDKPTSDSAPLKTVEYHAQPLNKVSKVQIRFMSKDLTMPGALRSLS